MGTCASLSHCSDEDNRRKYEMSEKQAANGTASATGEGSDFATESSNVDDMHHVASTTVAQRAEQTSADPNHSTRGNVDETGSHREGESFLSFALQHPNALPPQEERRRLSDGEPFGTMSSVHFMNAREGYPLGANDFLFSNDKQRQWDSEHGSVTSSHPQQGTGRHSMPDAFGDSNVFGGEENGKHSSGNGCGSEKHPTKRHSRDCSREGEAASTNDCDAKAVMDRSNALTDVHTAGADLTLLDGNAKHSFGIVTVFNDEGGGI